MYNRQTHESACFNMTPYLALSKSHAAESKLRWPQIKYVGSGLGNFCPHVIHICMLATGQRLHGIAGHLLYMLTMLHCLNLHAFATVTTFRGARQTSLAEEYLPGSC